jgi:hypothetical protein
MTKLRKLQVIISFVVSIIILALSLRVVGIIGEKKEEIKIAREENRQLVAQREELTIERDELRARIAEKEVTLLVAVSEKERMKGVISDLEVKISEVASHLEQEREKSRSLKDKAEKLIGEKANIEERHKRELALLEAELRTAIARYELQILAMTPAQDPTMLTGRVVVAHPPDYLAVWLHDLVASPLQVELFRGEKMVHELEVRGAHHATLLLRIPPGISLPEIKENDKVEVFLLPEAEDIMAFLENGKVRDIITPNFLNVDMGTAARLLPDVSIYRNGALVGRIVPDRIYLSVIMEAPDVRGIRRGDEIKIIR